MDVDLGDRGHTHDLPEREDEDGWGLTLGSCTVCGAKPREVLADLFDALSNLRTERGR